MHLPPSLLLPRTGLFTRRVHENRAVHCHLHPPNLTSVHHSAVDKHPAPRLTDWRRRGRNRERDTPTVFYTTHTHTRITAPTHPRTTTTQLPLPLPSLYGHLHRVPWSQSLHAARPLCFLTPHSSRVNTHSSTLRPARTRLPREQPPSSLHTPRQPIGDAQEWDACSAPVVGPILKPPTLRTLSHRPTPEAETPQNAIATSRARAETRCCNTTHLVHARRNIEPTAPLHVT